MTATDPFIIITETPGGSKVVAIEGVLDCHGSAEARNTLDDLIAKGCREILVDLQDVTVIDSHGLGVLVAAWRQVRKTVGNLVLWRPHGVVRKVIYLVRMRKVIEVWHG